ncbi:MAG: DoxX family protein [Parvularculaceae bacterium]
MRAYQKFIDLAEAIPYALLAFVARFAAAVPFWRSGQTKLDGGEFLGVNWNLFAVKDSKVYLFQYEFGIPEAIAPAAAHLAALGEFFLPILLVFGLISRGAALGLLAMTAFIQFYVFPEQLLMANGNWSMHLLWAAPLLLVLARGPGAFSLDALLGGKFGKAKAT